MKKMYRYLLSLLLLLPLVGWGQARPDTVLQDTPPPPDTIVLTPLRINGIRFGVDLKPWVHGIASSERNFYNAHLRVDVGRGPLVQYGAFLDLTHAETTLSSESKDSTDISYFHKGNSARLGIYLNVIPADPEHNLVTVGIGYGRSWFNERLSGIVEPDPQYGSSFIESNSFGLSAGWLELSGGMQARVWKQFFVGYSLSLKFFPHFKDRDQVRIYEIPGFGRANQRTSLGFSYYLLYRIPFK